VPVTAFLAEGPQRPERRDAVLAAWIALTVAASVPAPF
jgi:hypothetical protein